mgnify:FL=1
MKFKIKETYLLLVIVIGLISLSVYTTYALFTASTTINDVVSFNATLSTDNNLIEYEMVTLSPGEVKKIEVNVNNTYSTSLYYGTWYQVVSPSDTSDIVIGVPTESANPSSGAIAKTSSITVIVGLANNSSKTAVINIGTIGSTTSNLNLPTTRSLVPAGFNPTVPDLVINSFKVNGKEVTTFPINTGSYALVTTCSDASITFNKKTLKYEISNISKEKKATCGFKYNIATNRTKLNDYLISLAGTTQGTGELFHETFSNTTKLASSDYSNVVNDATYPFTWSDTDKTWASTNQTDSTTANIGFKLKSNGNYQICYTQSSEANYDYATISKNGTVVKSLKGVTATTFECYDLGTLSTNDLIDVEYQKDNSASSGDDKVVFYINKLSTFDTGYRYEGKDPNNYIFFNNETWRIIGVFDSSSHGVSNTNLVKIIRNDSIGGYAWDKSNTNDWPNSSLYHLLNDYYYTATDGTSSSYCYQYSTTITGNCDYTETGLQLDYRKMIQPVTWYLGGPSSNSNSTSTFYANERDSSKIYSGRSPSTTGNVGLMYASDYGYSVLSSSCTRTTNLGSYNTNACAGNTWLKKEAYEWTITPKSDDSNRVWSVYNLGNVNFNYASNGYVSRPVLYLKSDVKYISGTGTKSDPYIIDL